MSTIQSSLRLFDGMTLNRRKLANALNTVITSFESIENTYNNPLDMEALCAAQRELIEARVDIDQLEEALGKAREKEKQLENRTRPGLIKLAMRPLFHCL